MILRYIHCDQCGKKTQIPYDGENCFGWIRLIRPGKSPSGENDLCSERCLIDFVHCTLVRPRIPE